MNEIVVDKVVVPESKCRCGGLFMVLHVRGEPHDRIMHNKPSCPQYEDFKGNLPAYLHWVLTGEAHAPGQSKPAQGMKPNRRVRRVKAARERKAST